MPFPGLKEEISFSGIDLQAAGALDLPDARDARHPPCALPSTR